VQERLKQFGSSEQMSRQLQQLKEMAAGPAEEFARDMAKGDFQKAAEDLKKLQEKLASGQMSDQEKQELQRQLSQLKKELDKMAGLEERKKQLEEARKNGMISEQQYQQQKQKLEEQSKSMKSLQSLAQKLGECQQGMAEGNSQKASNALKAAEQQLQEMASNASELESLDSAMADLQDAKDSLTGEGMNQLGRDLEGMSSFLNGMGKNPGNGMGMGRGRGQGDRPEAPDKTSNYDSKVKQQITKGKAVLGGFADPTKQVRGESVLDVQGNVEAAASAASEALTDQKIPSTLKKHVQSYFDQVRKGE
jgi:myosin heavy subunit